MSTEQFIGYFAQYMNGLPPVMYLIIGNLLGWILAAAYPREVTRSVTEGLFQWVLIAISIIIIVLLPFLGFLHTFMDAWPIPFLVVFMVLYNGGLWAYYKYVYKKSENARLRKKNVGVATLDELVEELQGLRGAYTQYKNIAEQQQTKIGQLEKDVAAARAANGKG